MAYISFQPHDYFNTKLYSGTGGDGNAITSVGFSPNWVWLKERSSTSGHAMYDTIRGTTKKLEPHANDVESTEATTFASFDSDGFTVNNNAQINESGQTYASWNWKAGTSFSNDASATSVGSIDSTGSVSTTAGFSIISYTGNGSAGATVAHGLGVTPNWIIVKNREATENWRTFHSSLGNGYNINLSTNGAKEDSNDMWNDTSPTSSVFSIGTNNGVNKSGDNLIAYCFAEKSGFSSFGSYVGTGNDSGVFNYTGFKPAFVILKLTSGSDNWMAFTNKIGSQTDQTGGHNIHNRLLELNGSGAEQSAGTGHGLDFYSNGFMVREDNANMNGNGSSYIYIAFAEEPLVSSNGVPATAG